MYARSLSFKNSWTLLFLKVGKKRVKSGLWSSLKNFKSVRGQYFSDFGQKKWANGHF